MKKKLVCLLAVCILGVGILGPVLAQPPDPPEENPEDWYPPLGEEGATFYVGSEQITTSSSSTLNVWLENGNFERVIIFYGDDPIYLYVDTQFTSFSLWLYEWYPRGSTGPGGHWIFWARRFNGSGTWRFTLHPEQGEPEGDHRFGIWIYDWNSGTWDNEFIGFEYYEKPPTRAEITAITTQGTMKKDTSYSFNVEVKNTGIASSTFEVSVEGNGFETKPLSVSLNISPNDTKTAYFTITPRTTGPITPKVVVKAEGDTITSRSTTISVGGKYPGPITLQTQTTNKMTCEEEEDFSVVLYNEGEGTAEHVTAKIVKAEGFDVIKGTEALADISSHSSKTATFTVKPRSEGNKSIEIEVTYRDEEGNPLSDTVLANIYVGSKPPATLTIESSPNASVYINDENKGTTPLTIELKEGEYTIRIEKEGYKTYTKTIELSSGEKRSISANLASTPSPPTTLPITTPPRDYKLLALLGTIVAVIVIGGIIMYTRLKARPAGSMVTGPPRKEPYKEYYPKEVLLEVHQAKKEDAKKNIVRIDKKTRERLGVEKGEYVYVVGRTKAKAKVAPAHKEDTGKNIIRMNKKLREKAGVGFREKVRIEKVEEDEE